jgi:hypothetical protein
LPSILAINCSTARERKRERERERKKEREREREGGIERDLYNGSARNSVLGAKTTMGELDFSKVIFFMNLIYLVRDCPRIYKHFKDV